MAVINLESLVLRGVSVVVCDGQANNLRLGTGYAGMGTTPTIGRSMQHPSTDPLPPATTADGRKWQAFGRPAERIEPAVADRVIDAEVGGAGRSLGHAGISEVRHLSSSTLRKRALPSSSGETQASSIGACGRTRVTTRKS